jgi:acyl-ACP thioesterase
VYWQAVEDCFRRASVVPLRPLRARLDYRHAIDLGDDVELDELSEIDSLTVGFRVGELVKAVALVEQLSS